MRRGIGRGILLSNNLYKISAYIATLRIHTKLLTFIKKLCKIPTVYNYEIIYEIFI